MKNAILTHFFLCLALSVASLNALAQCDPLPAYQCPDPENNGQVCPDSLAIGFLNQPYSVVATILPPPAIDTLGFQVEINHITLDSVSNLPNGLTWESNAEGNEFYPGNYYCIIMQGTPLVADTFQLKIYIGVFVALFGDTIWVTQFIDSTSLSMIIVDNTTIAEQQGERLLIRSNFPNPFTSWTSILYYAEEPGPVQFELYSTLGKLVDSRLTVARKGDNHFNYPGDDLSPGIYFFRMNSDRYSTGGKIIRAR